MNVIFLDFDGVLNSVRSSVANHLRAEMLAQQMDFDSMQWAQLDRVAVGLIDKLCHEAPAKVVISSAWRIGTKLEIFQHRFKKMGMPHIEVIGKTGDDFDGHRGRQIKHWLAVQTKLLNVDVENFVIIDDDSDMLPEQRLNFVHVPATDGMLLRHFRDALRILNPKHTSLIQFDQTIEFQRKGLDDDTD